MKRSKANVLILVVLFSKMMGQYFSIQTPTIIPTAPTTFYPVKIITAYGTPNKSYKISKSFTVSTVQKTIALEACCWQSMATQPILQKDTFSIGQLSAGIYTVTFTPIGSFSSGICVPNPNINSSQIFTFEVFGDALAIQERVIGLSEFVYPNPVKDVLTIELLQPISGNSAFRLFNALGEVVIKEQLLETKHAIDMSRFASGIYFLEIRNTSVSKYIRIIKE